MSALTFTLKQAPAQRVDLSPLVCQKLEGLSLAAIAAIELHSGKAVLRVDTLFDISGSDAQNLVFRSHSEKLDCIGKALNGGSIRVEGNAGAYLGLQMKAGSITVSGNAGLYAACEMKNGLIQIEGNAGDFLGGALPGSKQGMKGGTVVVKGHVGDRCGDHLRRGQILIEGNAGEYCGSRMVAGTIAVMGSVGRHAGYAMRRGTLLLWNPPHLPASFNDCGSHTLAFLPILFASFKGLDSRFADSRVAFNRVRRFGGDMAETGRGEVLVRLAQPESTH
ncbi:MAG: formylmethanofuran dehydrogenase subunit C [Methylomonas sp.]|nr:formylmethanofuran dehydrogenase subunit C [Methylomonas sp.]PPD22217.1 MAG: formylmethanofuran dehydrogenase subunit C [Methylomonas sp.]PPD27754.1 MAG: formylmethanofuran dehydrogenase subunit C [Methylomonas sp.]PPD39764.1 MAG: formylmethanofuran dehydrogenase subunit C [Methylomonas sp.]PPD42538.1 MAG: formylmethanofuran dehydrogenase subunit C [Methylomonas sp.]